jgi:DNA-binding LacI/PurR family transcriptional regulator
LVRIAADQAAEAAAYRAWWATGRTDGVLLCDLHIDDVRIPVLEQLGMPAVAIGPPSACGSVPSVWSDDAVSVVETVRYLAGQGHRRLARVAGIAEFAHTRIRTEAFSAICAELRLDEPVTVASDYTAERGAQATRDLLTASNRPTAIIYDNDVMAVSGLTVAAESGLSVPSDLSIVAWDDSQVCQLVRPPLTAMSRDVAAYGATAAQLLLAIIKGDPVASLSEKPAHLNPRGTTAPPRDPAPPGVGR